MSDERKDEDSGMSLANALAVLAIFIVLPVLFIGEPDIHDAIIAALIPAECAALAP